jgi:hypothetical protein
MDRLLVVRCPDLVEDDEGGAARRRFVTVTAAVEAYCPWVTTVRTGICSLPARGPARYFGGEGTLVRLITEATASVTPVEVGVADGLFAALLAARTGLIVPAGGTPSFLAPFPVTILGDPVLAELLDRLGIRTMGAFAMLPEAHVLGRFGADGVRGHRVARGHRGELDGLRQPVPTGREGDTPDRTVTEVGFWGGVSDGETRAARSLLAVQGILGPDGVMTAHLQGGRGPAQRARFITWNARGDRPDDTPTAPWPGQIPPPAPALVYPTPLEADLDTSDGDPVRVTGPGLLTATPGRLSVEHGPWSGVTAWAGPWPSDERWWSRSRQRSARMQVVTGAAAYLLVVERGRWRVEAAYG